MTHKKELDFSRIHFSLAGSGNPWHYLTRTRVGIMREFHEGATIDDVANSFELTIEELKTEIQPLLDSSLVFETNGVIRPSFLIVDENETKMVHDHATSFSKNLATTMEAHFCDIEKSYMNLELSKKFKFNDVAFLFVGGRIVDIHLLEKLVSPNRIMPPAPHRPSPDRPDAHYYFWMIDGEKRHLGEYGLDDIDTPWSNWHYFSFGQNLIDGEPNSDRKEMDNRYRELVKSDSIGSPEILSQHLEIPLISEDDSVKWAKVSDAQAVVLSKHFVDHADEIKDLHSELAAEQYAPHSFGEFFCWYAHIAYSVTIDILESKGILTVPPERFQSALWYNERSREGLLVGL